MKRYQNLLFDLDDTLLDYGAAEDHSLQTLFAEYDLQLTPEVKRTFQDYNVKMWQRYERGELDWDAMQVHLFGDYFKVYHQLKVDGRQVIEHYLDLLAGNHQLVPGTRTDHALFKATRLSHLCGDEWASPSPTCTDEGCPPAPVL